MNKTKIEWCDYTINPVKGLCKNNCYYCYSIKMYKRFKWSPYLRIEINEMDKLYKLKKPSKIFIGSMHDIFGEWINDYWINEIINKCKILKQHTFLFLTKNPKRYLEFKFPNNCLLGATVTGKELLEEQASIYLTLSSLKNKKFISYEPLLGQPLPEFRYIDWVIIGGLTPKPVHKREWVDKIIEQARELGIPVFLKDNLKYPEIIKEYPKE